MARQKKKIGGKFSASGGNDSQENKTLINGISCSHLKRNVNANTLNKVLRKSTEFNCDECEKQGLKKDESGPIWACMQCGHKGCGRYSEHAHAISHSETPRSSSHRVVLNLDTLAIWCYDCDDEIPRESCPPSIRTILGTLRSFIKKSLESLVTEIHDTEFKQTEEEVGSTEKSKKLAKPANKLNLSQLPIKGLSNMGNTCFFNSVVQNLMQTNCLREMLRDGSLEKGSKVNLSPHLTSGKQNLVDCGKSNVDMDINIGEDSNLHPITITIETDLGNLTHAIRDLYQMFDENSMTVVTPRALFDEVCKKAHRFRSYEQQDSHELLRYLLDALRFEESIRRKAAILSYFGFRRNVDPKTVPGDVQRKLKAYDRAAELTCVEQIFGGELLQCIKCLQCDHVSTRVESFLDLSLPVVEKRCSMNKAMNNVHPAVVEKSNYASKKEQILARKQAKNAKRRKTEQEKNLLDSTIEKMYALNLDDENENTGKQGRKNSDGSFESVNAPTERETKISEAIDENNNATSDLDDEEIESSECGSTVFVNNALACDSLGDTWSLFTEPLDAVSSRPDTHACHLTDCLTQFMSTEMLCDSNKFGCENCTKYHHSKAPHRNKKAAGTVYTDALKKYIIFSPPAVLTLHLKRFHQSGRGFMKINKYVEFPRLLNLAPFCSKNCKRKPTSSESKILYTLYGVVSHSGRLSGGHYVAYVKLRQSQSRSVLEFLQNKVDVVKKVDKNNNEKDIMNFAEKIDSAVVNDPTNFVGNDLRNGVINNEEKEGNSDQWYYISDSYVSTVTEEKVMSCEAYLLFYERIL